MSAEATMDELGQGAAAGQEAGGSGHEHTEADHGQGGHASVRFYWIIGGILTVITAVEVALFYIPALAAALVPMLLALSAAKFILVVMFFMHLKFDSKIFSGVFLAGMVLALFMTTALIVLYKVLPSIVL